MDDQRTLALSRKESDLVFSFSKMKNKFRMGGRVTEIPSVSWINLWLFFFLYFQMPSFSLNLRQGVMELKKIWGWPDNSYVTGGKFTRCQSQIYGMHWDFLYLLPLGQSSLLSGTSGLHCVSLHSHFLVSQVPYARGFKYRPVTPSWELIICPSSLVLCFQERFL